LRLRIPRCGIGRFPAKARCGAEMVKEALKTNAAINVDSGGGPIGNVGG
jgi:hypothetical protein